jgi:uncharacterized membrane protein YqgA involved in biofilm formation
MTGTILNIVTVLIGSTLGILLGGRMSDRIRQTVMSGLGLVTLVIGIQMAIETANVIIVLGSLLVGGILGEWWSIEERLHTLGAWLEARVNRSNGDETSSSRFIRGFMAASLMFCVGPMAILGSISDGLRGDYQILAVKSVLDGFASLAFASTMGIGVAFSTLVILIYQGGLSLLAAQAQAILSDPMQLEMSATGGVLLIGLSFSSLLEIKTIRVANYLPALVLAPLIVWVLTLLGLSVAPQF